MDDNKFYLCWTAIVAVVIVLVAMRISFVSLQSKAAVVEMVKAGADPIAAACSVGEADSLPGLCVGLVVKK